MRGISREFRPKGDFRSILINTNDPRRRSALSDLGTDGALNKTVSNRVQLCLLLLRRSTSAVQTSRWFPSIQTKGFPEADEIPTSDGCLVTHVGCHHSLQPWL